MIPGYATPHEQELWRLAAELGIEADLRMPEWIAAADLEGLFALAEASVFPSLYEGFGLPVLEAMRRGVPVACSDRSSLPEVAGDAALMFDPEDVGAIAAAVSRLLADADLRAELKAAGIRQAARFTWKNTAELTVDSYRRALGARVGARHVLQRGGERQSPGVAPVPLGGRAAKVHAALQATRDRGRQVHR